MLLGLYNSLNLFRGVLLLLLICWTVRGQNCGFRDHCLFYDIPKRTSLTLQDSQLAQNLALNCIGNFLYNQVVSFQWLFTSNLSIPKALDVSGNSRLTTAGRGSSLVLTNATEQEEGAYYCQAMYADGSLSQPASIACIYVAGIAFYKVCPMTAAGNENCQKPTPLQAMAGESVDFNARIEFRHGGSCGEEQKIRIMFLRKILEDGSTENVYICSNLGQLSNAPCANRFRVSISFQGNSKYDIDLRLQNLTAADAGRYFLQVDLNGFEGGRRTSIYKNFTLAIKDKPVLTTPPAEADPPTNGISNCSRDFAPLLLLNGEVLSTESGLWFANISEGTGSLLCATNNENCCDGNNNGDPIARFVAPNKAAVTETPRNGLFVTKGRRIIRLNRRGPVNQEGEYCCSIQDSINDEQMTCIHINN